MEDITETWSIHFPSCSSFSTKHSFRNSGKYFQPFTSHFDTHCFCQFFKLHSLPPSLLRFLKSDCVFKIGPAVKDDLTHIKKQFDQLANQTSFNVIDLKEYALHWGILQKKESGSLETFFGKVLGKYLCKNDVLRKSDEWEEMPLKPVLLH